MSDISGWTARTNSEGVNFWRHSDGRKTFTDPAQHTSEAPLAQVIVLVSSITANPIQEVAQRNMLTTFKGKKIKVEEVDGVLPENKERRSAMFAKSGLTGKYPQVFIKYGDDLEFVGDAEKFNELCELQEMPKEILDANPDIVTFSQVFSGVELI